MLRRLEIQNYAIIEELELDLTKGLTIVTGETGAGKSILLGALGLIMGKRADTKVLYDQSKKCLVEATFDISEYGLRSIFERADMDYEEELIIRRMISTSGKSRAFVNDEPVNLSFLKELSDNLIDLHQQFDTLDLHSVSFQTKTIDALAGNEQFLVKYRGLFDEYKKDQKRLAELEKQHRNANQELDFLRFQKSEFDDAELLPGELKEKEQLLEKLTNAEDIQRIGEMIRHQIEEGENSILNSLQTVVSELSHLINADSNLATIYERLSGVQEELKDIVRESESATDGIEYDESQIEELNARIALILRLQKKHGVQTLEDLLTVQDKINDQLGGFGDLSDQIEELTNKLKSSKEKLVKLASKISKKRASVVRSFEGDVHEMLIPLSMENAYIKVQILPLDEPGPSGMDAIAFLFSPNKGSEFLPLKSIASGGEISRLTLCIKSLVANAMTLPTLIFDEIDTGVSGEVAARMGDILFGLAQNHQVLSITHSPQIASKANRHFFVHKNDKTDRTVTAIKELEAEERIIEIAKMLSGNPPSQAAIENAKELIG